MGRWRENYRSMDLGTEVQRWVSLRKVRYKTGLPVDASGVTSDGRAFGDIHDFRKHLVEQDEQLARNLTKRFVTFTTGAAPTFADREIVETILQETAPGGVSDRNPVEEGHYQRSISS